MIGHDITIEKREPGPWQVYPSAELREGLATMKAARLFGSTLERNWTNGPRLRAMESFWIL